MWELARGAEVCRGRDCGWRGTPVRVWQAPCCDHRDDHRMGTAPGEIRSPGCWRSAAQGTVRTTLGWHGTSFGRGRLLAGFSGRNAAKARVLGRFGVLAVGGAPHRGFPSRLRRCGPLCAPQPSVAPERKSSRSKAPESHDSFVIRHSGFVIPPAHAFPCRPRPQPPHPRP